jgi:hypothetical protein
MVKSNSSRKVLVMLEQRNAGEAGSMPIRRYRLARLRLDERAAGEEPRFEHLKRVYD